MVENSFSFFEKRPHEKKEGQKPGVTRGTRLESLQVKAKNRVKGENMSYDLTRLVKDVKKKKVYLSRRGRQEASLLWLKGKGHRRGPGFAGKTERKRGKCIGD